MSDSYSGASQLTAPSSAFATPSALAPSLDQIDRNFRRVTALEQATRLPALPDLVKMDLIQADGADEDSLTELLLGMDDVYNQPQQADQLAQAPPPTGMVEPGQSGVDQTRIIIAAMTGNKAPREVSPDAVKAFKLRAINQGMLDMDPRKVDNTWSPEFNRMRGEMAFDDYNAQMRGAHPGATTFERALGVLGEFTSPAGLLHMATELDMFWDFGAIGNEISTWGDKWRKVGDSHGIWDLGKNLVDALTGPIDDIVFPVINDALMFVGVGAVYNSARVGWQGAELVRAGGMFSKLFEGSGMVGRFYDFIGSGAARNLIEMRNPSMVSNLLGRGGRVLGGAGDALAAWRDLTPVVAGKQILQTGMRLGFAAALENRVPGYVSDGFSISDLPGGTAVGNSLQNTEEFLANQAMDRLGQNVPGIVGAGVITTGLELMFAPYNIFSPGTFFRHGADGLGVVSQGGRRVAGALGTTPGRAVAGGVAGAVAGTIAGDDVGDIAKGAAIGAGVGAALPLAGRALEVQRIHQGLTGALLGAAGGAILGDSNEDIALGAIAGVGLAVLPSNVRRRVYEQAGIHGLDQLLQGVGHRMVRTSFQMVERDQEATVGFYNGIRRTLLNSPDELAQWDHDVQSLGVPRAWANRRYGGDVNMASAEITWAYSTMAIRWIAAKQSDVIADAAGKVEAFDMARGKLMGQLKPIDVDPLRPVDDLIADVASRQAWQEHGGLGGDLDKVRARQRDIVERLTATPEQAYRLAAKHNRDAGDTIAQLWDPRNFPNATYVPRRLRKDGMADWASVSWRSRRDLMADHTAAHFNQAGDFSKFTAVTDSIRTGRADGLFDDMSLKPITDRYGRVVDPYTRKVPRDPKAVKVNEAIGDLMADGTVDPAKVPGVDVLSSAHEAGRVTVGKIGQLWKGDLEEWAEKVADIVDTTKVLRQMQSKNWQAVMDLVAMDDAFKVAKLGEEVVTDRQIVVMAQQAVKKGVNKKGIQKLLKFAQRHGVPLSSLDTTLRKLADDAVNDARWVEHNFGRYVNDAQGNYLDGEAALTQRLKQLRVKAQHTAAELDLDGMIARAEALPPVPDGHVRLWRGDPVNPPAMSPAEAKAARAARGMDWIDASPEMQARDAVQGRWFTTDSDLAKSYPTNRDPDELNRLNYVDIPEEEYARIKGLVDQPDHIRALSAMPDREVILPEKYLGSVRGADKEFSARAAQLRELKEGLATHGYTAVHGVQFLMPEDLSFNVPTFTDVTRRHLNAVTHGNWFGRRPPIEARLLDDRRRKLALVDELAKVGTDVSPEDDMIVHILDNLEEALKAEQDDVAASLNLAHEHGFVSRTADRIRSSYTPVRLDDLGGFRRGKEARITRSLAKMNLSDDEVKAVGRAINRFRNSDFHDMGLFAIESYLRGKSAPAGFLKMLGGTKYGGRVTGRVARQAATGALVGGAIGAVGAGSDASFEDRLKAALVTGGVGAAAGGLLSAGVNKWDASKGIIQTAEDFKYGYLADGYARLRDSMRFTLSPFFDLSRYTEGLMLAQTAAPLRDAAGRRLVTPLNASPRALRSRIAREAIETAKADGVTMSKAEARRVADASYNRSMAEFKGATKASGDFDVDAIDSAGQWFRQVGVLGFSPTDWMATAFANLRATGMNPDRAYHAAREMYQYGVSGRSAAEMSVNFIFFPFSFQKKALTHIGKWLNDDLGRSIILHDALKTYEVLDEKYNLDDYWREHIPFLTQLNRLNLFAYGISPGRLGGINSQALEGVGKVALNMFLPVGTNIRDASAGKELEDIGKQMLPLLNDINWMTHDIQEIAWPELRAIAQRTPLRSAANPIPMAMESYQAQVTDGWAEWNAYRTDFEAKLATEGYTTTDVTSGRNDWLEPLRQEYLRKQDELAQRYPAWWSSKIEVPGNAIALSMEKEQRINNAMFAIQDGRRPSPDNAMVAEMQQFIDSMQEQVQLVTGSTDLEFAPPQVFDQIHQMAAEFASLNPGFVPLWNKFWRNSFGDLTTPMRLAG